MRCVTTGCTGRGRGINYGWCEECYYGMTFSFDRSRREAEMLTNTTGKNWLVCELTFSCDAVRRAAKLGKKAYGVYPAKDRKAIELDGGYVVVYEHSPEGKVFDAGAS